MGAVAVFTLSNMERQLRRDSIMHRPVRKQDILHCKDVFTYCLSQWTCASAIVRPNLQLYRDRFAVHKELHSELREERPARWPCCLSWHILMWLGTINRCCAVFTVGPRQPCPPAGTQGDCTDRLCSSCWPGCCLPQSPVNFTVLCYGLRIHS